MKGRRNAPASTIGQVLLIKVTAALTKCGQCAVCGVHCAMQNIGCAVRENNLMWEQYIQVNLKTVLTVDLPNCLQVFLQSVVFTTL